MKDLLIGTKNENKFHEVVKILEDLKFEFHSLLEMNRVETVEETGETFRENAVKKACEYSEAVGMLTIADDSGLSVDVLDGAPGVYSSRFAGLDAEDAENNKKLLQKLNDVNFEDRKASFICYIAIADSGKLIDVCKGECKGNIAVSPSGNSGFGYDPIFTPEGYEKTFAELGQEVKNRLSHRYKALMETKEKLKNLT